MSLGYIVLEEKKTDALAICISIPEDDLDWTAEGFAQIPLYKSIWTMRKGNGIVITKQVFPRE